MFTLYGNNYTEKGSVTTNHIFRYEGLGIDAQSVWREYVTKFSIAKGCICYERPTDRLWETDHKADDKNGTVWPLKRYNNTFIRRN